MSAHQLWTFLLCQLNLITLGSMRRWVWDIYFGSMRRWEEMIRWVWEDEKTRMRVWEDQSENMRRDENMRRWENGGDDISISYFSTSRSQQSKYEGKQQ